MPYNPGIQYRGDQSIGQGISQFGQGIGSGLAQLGLNKQKNKLLEKAEEEKQKKIIAMGKAFDAIQKQESIIDPKHLVNMSPAAKAEMLGQYAQVKAMQRQQEQADVMKKQRQRETEERRNNQEGLAVFKNHLSNVSKDSSFREAWSGMAETFNQKDIRLTTSLINDISKMYAIDADIRSKTQKKDVAPEQYTWVDPDTGEKYPYLVGANGAIHILDKDKVDPSTRARMEQQVAFEVARRADRRIDGWKKERSDNRDLMLHYEKIAGDEFDVTQERRDAATKMIKQLKSENESLTKDINSGTSSLPASYKPTSKTPINPKNNATKALDRFRQGARN